MVQVGGCGSPPSVLPDISPSRGEISCGDRSFSHKLCTSGCCIDKDVRSKPLVDLTP